MKRSYIKIFILEITLISILLLDTFIFNKLNSYTLIGLLIISYIALRLMLGIEKNHYRYSKDIILSIIIYLLIALSITYLIGVFASFYKNSNYLNGSGIFNFILPTIITIIVSEIFRNNLVKKSEGSKTLFALNVLLFTIVDIALLINPTVYSSKYNLFLFFSLYIIPSLVKNIMCTYLTYKAGYKPAIVYRLIFELYGYLVPILPNYGDYINSIVKIVIPVGLIILLYNKLKDATDEEVIISRNSPKQNIIDIAVIVVVLVIVYLTSGSFKYYALAIGSDSMNPNIHKGDMVIVYRLKEKDKKEIKVGDILVHKYGKTTIVHRVNKIYNKNNDFIVYTKGDANNEIDNYPIDSSMMIGVVKMSIPLIGYPTVFLSET